MNWLRLYTSVAHDPKVQTLPGEDFKAWITLLCLARENDGRLPPMDDIAYTLRRSSDDALAVVERLCERCLIDRVGGGQGGYGYAPHGWQQRQYKSDNNNQYVKDYRERKRNLTDRPSETDTEQIQNRTEQTPLKPPTQTPAKAGRSAAPAGWTAEDDQAFTAWWALYPAGRPNRKAGQETAAFAAFAAIPREVRADLMAATVLYRDGQKAEFYRTPQNFLAAGYWRSYLEPVAEGLKTDKENGNGRHQSASERRAEELRNIERALDDLRRDTDGSSELRRAFDRLGDRRKTGVRVAKDPRAGS